MARSMTGFGTATAREDGWRAEVTIRTWNHRYLSVRTRSLNDRPQLQSQIEARVKETFRRGEIGVSLDLQPDRDDATRELFDPATARAVHAELKALADDLGLPPPTLNELIRAGGLQTTAESDADVWLAVSAALDEALTQTNASRAKEGQVLCDELERILGDLSQHAERVTARLPEITDALRTRLMERIAELQASVDAERFETELALLVDRFDVQEELVRLRGHIDRAAKLLKSNGSLGKELDFLSQEMLREVNTTGSKARDSEVSGTVIDMKLCVEQFREQVQNVE